MNSGHLRCLGHQRYTVGHQTNKVLKETCRFIGLERLLQRKIKNKKIPPVLVHHFLLSLALSLLAHCLSPKGSLHSFPRMNKMYSITANQQECVSDKKLSVSYCTTRSEIGKRIL